MSLGLDFKDLNIILQNESFQLQNHRHLFARLFNAVYYQDIYARIQGQFCDRCVYVDVRFCLKLLKKIPISFVSFLRKRFDICQRDQIEKNE